MRLRIFGMMLFVVFLLIVGCGERESVLAVAGRKDVVTVEDFHQSFGGKKSMPDLRSMSLEERREQLDRVIDRRIKLLAAYESGLDEDSIVVARVEDMKKRRVVQKLYEAEILDRIVKESDIREHYARTGKEVILRKIVIAVPAPPDSAKTAEAKDQARGLLNRIRVGEDFSALAREFSDDPATARKGGLLEPLTWKGDFDPVVKAAFEMKVGDVSGPIETREGLALIKLEEIRGSDRKPYAGAREEIKKILQRAKTPELQQAARDYLEEVKETNQVRFFEKGMGEFTDMVKEIENPVPGRIMEAIDGLDAFDQKRVLVSYQGKDFTFLSFKELLGQYPPERPLHFTEPRLVQNLLDRWLTQELLFERSLKKRLDRDEDVQNSLRDVREAHMIQLITERDIHGDMATTDADVEAYYEEHKEDKYVEQARVKVQEVMVKDEATAQRVARMAKSGIGFGSLVQDYTERIGYKKRGGIINYFMKGRWGAMGDAAFEMSVGEIRGPVDLGNDQGFSIIKLLDKEPSRIRELQEVRALVESDLKKSIKQEREDAWLEEKRAKYGVRVFEDELARAFAD